VTRLTSISVDLDSLEHYCLIQGLSVDLLDARARDLVGAVAVPRIMALCEQLACPVTLFVVTSDLVQGASLPEALRAASRAGAELASHSHSHDYTLSRWAVEAVKADLEKAHRLLTDLTGQAPLGFRAPGYTLSAALLEAVVAQGYRYDSSAFPATPYYLAKASVMAALQLIGRPSKAILDTPQVLLAPTRPYHPALDAPYRKGQAPVIELPVSVTPRARVPVIGTLVTTAPWPLAQRAVQALADEPFVNFELHAIDFLDQADGIPPQLAAQQRDVRVPWAEKCRRLSWTFEELKRGREVLTLAQAASKVQVT
jgi:peptidoglycan-N-acetylglucosamine deacetylase